MQFPQPAVALESHVLKFDVSAAVANITSVKVRDHGQEALALYAVAAACMVNRLPTRFHVHSTRTYTTILWVWTTAQIRGNNRTGTV